MPCLQQYAVCAAITTKVAPLITKLSGAGHRPLARNPVNGRHRIAKIAEQEH